MWHKPLKLAYITGRKIIIALIGSTVILIGIALIFTPGPAIVVIPAGLAILSLEFAWAKRWLKQLRQRAAETINKNK